MDNQTYDIMESLDHLQPQDVGERLEAAQLLSKNSGDESDDTLPTAFLSSVKSGGNPKVERALNSSQTTGSNAEWL